MARIILNSSDSNEMDIGSVGKEKAVSLSTNKEMKKQDINESVTGFPEWNLVPPMQVIKRVRRSL